VSQSLQNRVAVVTGADLQVGRGLAVALGNAGASIGLLGDARALAGVVADLEAVDARATAVALDASTRETVLQASFGQMQGRGGRIIVVIPTIAMSGAERLAPYVTAAEGQRLLVKAAARQWGADAIGVNCLAVAPEQLPIDVATTAAALAAPAFGGPGNVEHDLGPIAVFLAGDAGHYLTGATLCADGGTWMAP